MPLVQVFPVIGLLLQAPYEGNKNWSTMLALARWLGNPIAGMSYVFWNIRVTGRCAMILDMATPYNVVPGPDSQFAQIRDSLYLLAVMNQCTCSMNFLSRQELNKGTDLRHNQAENANRSSREATSYSTVQ